MIKFINGKYKYGNNDGISYSIYDEILLDGWTDDELTEDCWILEIPKDISKIHLFNARIEGIEIIPRDYDDHDENRKIFWESFETYVFGSLKKALIFIKNYDGDFKTEIEEFYESIEESPSEKEISKMISKPKSQYKTVYEWKEAAPEYFEAAVQNGWLNKVCDEIGWEYYDEEKDIIFLNRN
ncbi:hypothetical protein [Seonamhaeicola maritimus]|uniref:Uncharacterized protein n=1 Tax=Seonamhaeicola maritimus TaxID=2591822 RepID=A0A5C7GHD6_9FLAO|nr:hypothetical protein [Seonamhaeicola maritimus]TXG36721.1 hypothetical protein FUA22_09060 [Seonamhaeicola maritimus]